MLSRKPVLILLLILVSAIFGHAEMAPSSPIVAKTSGMEKHDGYFPFYWDAKAGKLWLQIDRWNTEFLYVTGLPAGVGSNDIGLDRGQISGGRIVRFERTGPRVLLVEPNYSYRAVTNDVKQRRAVEESFATSVLWGFEVAAEDGETVLVDATSFFLADAHDAAGQLKRTGQGTFRLDASRSALYLPRTKNFPLNTEVEATLTFTTDDPGNYVRQVTPTPQAVTVREHHSFLQLPDSNYTPRRFDARAGYFPIGYADYATPISEPIDQMFIVRHRLQKKDPSAAVSDPVKPIIYYVDPAAPEPIRSALMEGASWWNQAFEAAGYRNAFQVKLLPDSADPMDARYNLIQWVHRATRGWSYGNAIADPRTGEIIKGHVTLGSLRVRQDFLIAEGLIADYEAGKPMDPRMEQMAVARIRQLAAHEVGHTLGLSHNYIASTAGRASVMDYPAPLAILQDDGSIDLSKAYATGIGAWDKVAITYGYQDFPRGTNEHEALDSTLLQAASRGLIYLTDQDARPQGSVHPRTHLWDNGTNAVDELARVLSLRQAALNRFSEKNIRPGTPMAQLEDVLVPVYMGHRYQVEAVSKELGGLEYTYALRGDGQVVTKMVPGNEQRRALAALIGTLSPDVLTLPERIISAIPPRPAGYERTRELFKIRTGMTFDPLSAAETGANMTASLILHPARAARLVEYHDRDATLPGLDEVIDRLLAGTWRTPHGSGIRAEIIRTSDAAVLYNLLSLGASTSTSTEARAIANLKIHELQEWIKADLKRISDPGQKAHYVFALDEIQRFFENPKALELTRPADPPDGPPIGSDQD